MAFWGIEVKPAKPYTHSYDSARGRLRITQAVLGNGKSDERSTLQCNVGNKSPILLCILKPDICESFHLELEFEENEQVVFSVLGKRSINLSGYFLGSSCDTRNTGDSDTESYGEDIDHSESDDDIFANLSEDDEYESDFIDDDDNIGMLSTSPRRKSGVVIEEIVEDEKPANGNANRRRLKKKNQISDSDDGDNEAQRKIVVKADHSAVFESEDEDGFPIALARNKDAKNAVENARSNDKSVDEDRKRKVSDISSDDPEPARETCQPLDSSTQAEAVDVNSEKPKKKKRVKDTPDQNQTLDEKEISQPGKASEIEISQPGKASEIEISQPGKASEIGVEVDDGPENIGKSKKKKEKAKKGKTSEAGVHSEEKTSEEPKATPNGEKTGEEPKATPNGALNIDTELDADQIIETIGKLKKNIKKKKLKDETLQDKNDVSTSEENQQIKVVDSQNMDVDKLDLELPKDESPKQDSKKKNKKKKKKNKNKDANTIEQSVDTAVVEGMDDEKDGARPAKPRTFSNGLTIEELSMGKPDGKRAAPGSKVKVHYTGKLRNGKVFDSTKRTPFGFRLGIGEVIKGWDVGVNGMRVGDKRRLTIPPAMGYGTKAVGAIPANSWLLFDVELVDVK